MSNKTSIEEEPDLADEEKTHEVNDKRRVNPDGTMKQEAEADAEEPQQEAELQQEEIAPPDVYQTLQFIISLFAEQAWQFMGLHLPPGSKEPVTDLTQAKIAIDAVVFAADKLHPHLNEEERKAVRGIISDLQINFVQKNS